MAKLVRPALSDSGNRYGARDAGSGDEVGEREVPSGPGVYDNHAKQGRMYARI
jgi:hypothetical protein